MPARTASYTAAIAFSSFATGLFYLDHSEIDGPDGLYDTNSYQFDGAYDDVTADVDGEVRLTCGTDSLAGAVQASSLELELLRATDWGYWNPNNPSSLLNSVTPGFKPMRPVRLRASADGSGGTLTTSGNEVTDATRAASFSLGLLASGQMCDGLSNDSSFGIRRAATNLFRRGQCDSLTDWTSEGVLTSKIIDTTTPAPFAPQCVKVVTSGASVDEGVVPWSATGQAAAAGTSGVGSIYIATTPGLTYKVYVEWVNTDASVTSGAVTTHVGGSAPADRKITVGGVTYELVTPAAVAVAAAKTGDQLRIRAGTGTIRVETIRYAHPMLEKGQTVVAPYVATSGGATATHAAGRVQAPASLLSAAQGWVAARVRMSGAASARTTTAYVFDWQDGGLNNRIGLRWSTGLSWVLEMTASGVASANAINGTAGSFVDGQTVTLVAAWDANWLYISVNGGTFTKVARTIGTPTGLPSTIDIGSVVGTLSWLDGDVLWFACGTGTLTDADAAWLHAELVAGREPWPADISDRGSAACTATWPADTAVYLVPGTTYGLFFGFIRRATWNSTRRSCELYCEDLLLWASRSYPVIAATGPTTTGAAIGLILDDIGWTDPAYRSLAAGDPLDNFSADGTSDALQLIASLLEAERGTVFVRGDGVVVYEDRGTPQVRTSSGTLHDVLTDLDSATAVDGIYTRASVTKTGGPAYTATDADAEQLYGRADLPAIDSPYVYDAAALADDLIYERKAPQPPVTATLDNEAPSALLLQLGTALQTVYDVADDLGGTAGTYVVQRAVHRIDAQGFAHSTEWLMKKRPTSTFALDVSSIDGSDDLRY